MAGQAKRFKNGKELIDLWEKFCDEIIENEFDRAPTQTNFCKWLRENYKETDRRTIYNSLNKYFPTVKNEFEKIQSDVIAEGSMLGKYHCTMSIFALKNWCGWRDSPSNDTDKDNEIKITLFRGD